MKNITKDTGRRGDIFCPGERHKWEDIEMSVVKELIRTEENGKSALEIMNWRQNPNYPTLSMTETCIK